MKKLISLLLVILFLFAFSSCGENFNKTSTGYKNNIKWGMSVSEVAEQLGDLVIMKTGTDIIAKDDEMQGIRTYASVFGGGDAKYKFTNDGKLYEIEFEIKDPDIDYEDFENIVDLYKIHYDDLDVGEIDKTAYDEQRYTLCCDARCDIDEYTDLCITYIKNVGFPYANGTIIVSYRHNELYINVLLYED